MTAFSIAETAKRTNIAEPSVWDLETHDDELTMVYSPSQLQHFAAVLGVRPSDLLGTAESDDSTSCAGLASAIRERCRERGITVKQVWRRSGLGCHRGRGRSTDVLDRFQH